MNDPPKQEWSCKMETESALANSPKFVETEQEARHFFTRQAAETRMKEVIESIGAQDLYVSQVFANGTMCFLVYFRGGLECYYLAD